MSSRRRGLAVGALFLCAIAFGNAAADSPPKSSSVTTTSTQTPVEQRTQAAGHVARIELAARRVRKMSDGALQAGAKDMLKVICLSDKVAQLQALSSSATSRQRQHDSALSVGDTDLANHHFAALGVLRRRAEQLDTEANQCEGTGGPITGIVDIKGIVDPNIADPGDPYTGLGGASPIGNTTPTIPVEVGSPKK
ncbi:MAG: hypothetical protein ACHREM_15710 [Polyangiales bacterium]